MKLRILTALALSLPTISALAQFSAGNLAVLRIGNGVETLTANGNSSFVDQFTVGGTLVNSVAIPNSGAGSVVLEGNRTAAAFLSLSANKQYLTFAGYNTLPGNGGAQVQGSTTVPRVVGQVSMSGSFSIGSSTTVGYSGQSFRSALTDGAGNYWGVGSGTGLGGPYYFGSGTPGYLQSPATFTTLRASSFYNGEIYFSHTGSAGGGPGIYKFTGMPTGTAIPSLFLSTGTGAASGEFEISPGGNVVYVADDRSAASGGGIQKWTFDGTAWSLAYTIASGSANGARGLAVDWSGINPIIYATTGEGSSGTANKLVSYTDLGAGTATVIATAGATTFWRGLELIPVPEPTSAALLGLGFLAMILRRRN